MTDSRAKGCRGELDAARAWEVAMGGEARRGQQFAGGTDSPDVVTSYGGIHLEVKRVERGNPYDWVDQAVRDAAGKVPVVLHRRNNQPWLIVMRLADVPKFILEAQAGAKDAPVAGRTLACHVSCASVPTTDQRDAGLPRVFPAE